MNASLSTLLLVLLGAAACAASSPPPPGIPGGPSCREIEQRGVLRIAPVIASHRKCSHDSDCEGVSQGGTCFDHCTIAMAHDGDPAFQAITADVAAHECSDFAALGCRAESPPCSPPPAAACHGGYCE